MLDLHSFVSALKWFYGPTLKLSKLDMVNVDASVILYAI